MNREDAIKLANDMAFMASIWVDDKGNEVNDLVKFAKLVAAKERELCKKECMEQFELSLSANEKAKRVRDKEAYLNSAIGAKYCLMRIDARGEA